jgi:SNF2 family DNA or RNA helicase
MPSSRSSSKKAKTAKSKSRKNSRRPLASKLSNSSRPNLNGHNNFWESIDAANQMNTEPTVEGVAPNTGGRSAALRGIKARANAPSEAKKAAALDAQRLKKANQSFVTKKGKTFRNKSVKAVTGGWLVNGMKTPLKSYQLINCGWMRSRELGVQEPYGGILADQMGLGKTVTCLANMVNGRPLKSFPEHLQHESHTTLIIVPSSLLYQWKAEIKKHTKKDNKRDAWGLGRVFVFRDSMSEEFEAENFAEFDVVLTTYYDVRRSWPDCKYPEGLSELQRHDFWLENFLNKRGPLHEYGFLRIVLDEGHQIANPETQIANACFNLIADYKWVLTGTP